MKIIVRAAAAIAALAISALPVAADEPGADARWSLAIHGGAGVIERDSLTPEQDAAYRAALERALEAGAAVLRSGGSALDAVQAAVQLMEDDPLFNAGRGAVFTADGRVELDAAIMDGATLNAAAVAGVTRTRHPIALARAVMEHSPHVMLIGAGADAFAAEQALEQVDPAFFFTERRWRGLVGALEAQGLPVPERPEGAPAPGAQANLPAPPLNERKFGTVGAVALDSEGRLAAATSTGGMTAKRWGRVGDVPVIGAGTYASNADGCAVSATGSGEYFIRATVARDICAFMGASRAAGPASVAAAATAWDVTCRLDRGAPCPSATLEMAAAQIEIDEVGELGGEGGVIVIGAEGDVAFAMNTSGMYRGSVASSDGARVAIYADED